jgi:hypothetical protein
MGLGAAALKYTEHAFDCGPVRDLVPQETTFSDGRLVAVVALPVPVKLTTASGLVEELLVTVSFPVWTPAAAGRKCTFRLIKPPELSVSGSLLPPSTE